MTPLVSIILPVYNAENHLHDAIRSIINQTLTDFELLIIDDGSTDASRSILESYTDKRIRLLYNETNLKIVRTLNRGFDEAKGEFIARMDSDDFARPRRLEKQVRFLQKHQDILLCGTAVQTSGVTSHKWNFPTNPEMLRCELLFSNVLAHPSVMCRRKVFDESGFRYSVDYPYAEDYELWVRASGFYHLSNLKEVLLEYRISEGSSSRRNNLVQENSIRKVQQTLFDLLSLYPTESQWNIHRRLEHPGVIQGMKELSLFEDWLIMLRDANRRTGKFPQKAFERVLAGRWWYVCRFAAARGIKTWCTFANSALVNYTQPSIGKSLKLLLISSLKRQCH